MQEKNHLEIIKKLEFIVGIMEKENASKVFNMNVSRTRDSINFLGEIGIKNELLTNLLRELMICKKEDILTAKEEQQKTEDIIYIIKDQIKKLKNTRKAA